jgi:Rad3-related DNA helicase
MTGCPTRVWRPRWARLSTTAPWVDLESPFDGRQLEVRIAHRISTRYRHRDRSLLPIAGLMARQYHAQPGNYLAFFGSFDYLVAALAAAASGSRCRGVFAEGVDLPGDRLIGAFIATLGMPRVCPVNAEIERRMHGLFGAGYEYTYLYPGLQKVVQAAARVIRTLTDRGTVHLMDERYAAPAVRELLPRWWRMG